MSAFREALGTSRKYAVPLLEWFDAPGSPGATATCGSPATVRRSDGVLSGHLRGDDDLDARAERQRRHPDRGASVLARIAEHVDQELAGTVGDLWVLDEVGRRREVHRDLGDPHEAVEAAAERLAQRRERLQRGPPAALGALVRGTVGRRGDPGAAPRRRRIGTWPATYAVSPAIRTGDVGGDGLRGRGQLDPEVGQALR